MLLASWRPSIKSLLIIGICLLFNSLLFCNSASARGKVTIKPHKTPNQHQTTKNPAIEFKLPTVLATSGEGSPQESITNNLRFRDLAKLAQTSKEMRAVINPIIEKKKRRHAELRDQIVGPNSRPFENILSYIDTPRDMVALRRTSKLIEAAITNYRSTDQGKVHFLNLDRKGEVDYKERWTLREKSSSRQMATKLDHWFEDLVPKGLFSKIQEKWNPFPIKTIHQMMALFVETKGQIWFTWTTEQKNQLIDGHGIQFFYNSAINQYPTEVAHFLYERWKVNTRSDYLFSSKSEFKISFLTAEGINARKSENQRFKKDWEALSHQQRDHIFHRIKGFL